MRVIALLALCIAAVSAVPASPQRIVGGSVTTIDQYPTIASLLYSWNWSAFWQSCAGTILNNRSILTAAYCLDGDPIGRWRVRVGSTFANSGGVVHEFANIFNHPNYNNGTHDSDITILRTVTAISHNNNVQPAPIAGANYNLVDNQVVWAAGWGRISQFGPTSEQLRHVQVLTVNQEICANRYAFRNIVITDNMLCSGILDYGERDHCYGDAGGPLYHHGVVVGVSSFSQGCGLPFYPTVNTRVSRMIDWIVANA